MPNRPKLSLGPIPYYWPKTQVIAFYAAMAETPVDIVYLGETVCPKRHEMQWEDWLQVAAKLSAAGKEVVLSTLVLIEAEAELQRLRRICGQDQFLVEANDLGAVQFMQGKPFVAGLGINVYNDRTVQRLARQGMVRWVLPVELGQATLADMQRNRPADVATEVFAYGRLPLAYSARCFTARAHHLTKDDCQSVCLKYPDGLLVATQDETEFLNFNGVQVQSACTHHLLADIASVLALGVDVLRISPQANDTGEIVKLFDSCLRGECDPVVAAQAIRPLLPSAACNGYWHGEAGMQAVGGLAS